jgi:hypothetical protein
VAQAVGTFAPHDAVAAIFTVGLTLAGLNAQLQAGYVWNAPTTALNAGDGQSFAVTFTSPTGNFLPVAGTVTVNIAKATVDAPTGLTAITGSTLASVALPAGWAWVNEAEAVGAVGSRGFLANFTPADAVNFNARTNVSITVTVNPHPNQAVAQTAINDLIAAIAGTDIAVIQAALIAMEAAVALEGVAVAELSFGTHADTAALMTATQIRIAELQGSGLSAGAIVGIVFGSIFGAIALAVGVFAFFWFVIKKKTWAQLTVVLKKLWADFTGLFKKKPTAE